MKVNIDMITSLAAVASQIVTVERRIFVWLGDLDMMQDMCERIEINEEE